MESINPNNGISRGHLTSHFPKKEWHARNILMNNYSWKKPGSLAKCYTSGSTLIHMTIKPCIHLWFHDNRLSYALTAKTHCYIYKRIGGSCFALHFLHFIWQIISQKGSWSRHLHRYDIIVIQYCEVKISSHDYLYHLKIKWVWGWGL